MNKAILFLSLSFLFLAGPSFAKNDKVAGHKKPDICLQTNIRCILKQLNGKPYWCLKSNIQRNLDARRNTTPIKKTRRENLGHCAKMITID